MQHPWAIEEAVLRPALTLVVCALVPFATARVLRAILLGRVEADREARARQLVPVRRAAFIVGVAQLQLAWMAGTSALGPALSERAGDAASLAFGALSTAIAFLAGGIARRGEDLPEERATALGVAVLRLRLLAFLAGPVLTAIALGELPLLAWEGAWTVRWGWVAAALALALFGVAYGGLFVAVLTGALRFANGPVREVARAIARAEGTSLWLVLRLPTAGTRFANAAAIPWARTMIVSDALVELLEPRELRAVLAHEAGHLSEPPIAAVARLGIASLLVFTIGAGVELAVGLGADPWIALAAAVALVLPGLFLVRRVARAMEIRADERARASAGAESLGNALLKLHRALLLPMTTGAKRVHPDLYDRLRACGRVMGERPPPPRARMGLLVGVVLATMLGAAVFAAWTLTSIDPAHAAEAGDSAARWRLRVDPRDPVAMLAAGWGASARGAHERALGWAAQGRAHGADETATLELEAEVHAARGECDEARALFDRALRARAAAEFEDPLSAPLVLGGYHLPPSMLTRCGDPESAIPFE